MEQYRSTMNDMCDTIEDFEEVETLVQCFSSTDPLEEIDIGDRSSPRPTFVNKNMSLEHKYAIIKLLKELLIVSSGTIMKCLDLAESW
jgi:hypothetical protein